MKRITIGIALGAIALGAVACGGDQNGGPLEGVESIVFIERQPRTGGLGDIFQFESYIAGARLMQLSPPTADGELTELLPGNHPEFQGMDIIDFDISYEADVIVVSARLSDSGRYGLYIYDIASGDVEQVPTDPNEHYVYPTFLPSGAILFQTTAVVEPGGIQFRDEYERRTTLQPGSVNRDGSDMTLFPRNLSHNITTSVLSDGHVLATRWDHLGDLNAGHIVKYNPDGSQLQEVFGKEGTGVANSYYKALEVAPGRLVTIASSRDMTFQSGAILEVRMGEAYEQDGIILADRNMSEANASYRILTQAVPLGEEPSSTSIGRYYSAVPLNAKNYPDLLVTWADGPVQSDVNAAAGVAPEFGIYLYDSERGVRKPIYDNPGTWEINATPLVVRDVPPDIPGAIRHNFDDDGALFGAMNVYDSSINNFADDSVYGVRFIEGFSGEEGVGRDFGLTEHEGAAILGYSRVQNDGSFLALVPPNIPIHQQAVDVYGMSLQNEPVWVAAAPKTSNVCGGCHEDRAATTVINPGITAAFAVGPENLMSDVTRYDRVSSDFTLARTASGTQGTVDIPWDLALQPIFDAKCISCHNGDPALTVNGQLANPSYSIVDPETGASQTITFDLRGQEIQYYEDGNLVTGYSASHLSIMGPDMMELEDAGLEVVGDMQIYMEPLSARDSLLIQILNTQRMFPAPDPTDRAFGTTTHGDTYGFTLTAAEEMLFIEKADTGGQFYSRLNSPGLTY